MESLQTLVRRVRNLIRGDPDDVGRAGDVGAGTHREGNAAAGGCRNVLRVSRSVGVAAGTSGLLNGVTADDPASFLAMLGLIGAVALVAGYLPARRALRIDPMIALRAE